MSSTQENQAMSAEEDLPPSREEKHRRSSAVLGVIAGLLAVLSAVLGFFNVKQTEAIEDKSTTITNVTNESDKYEALAEDRAKTIDELKNANDDLEKKLAAAQAIGGQEGGAGTDPNANDGPAPAVRHAGRLDITTSTQPPDLDAPAKDTTWSRGEEVRRSGDGEAEGPYIGGTDVNVYNGATHVFRDATPTSYSDCASLQTYATDYIPVGELDQGDSFCIRTSAGRFARLVVAQEASAAQISFDVTVWEKA